MLPHIRCLVITLIVVMTHSGCDDLGSVREGETGLFVVQPIVDLGVVHEAGAKGKFKLSVRGDRPVRIERVSFPCCGKVTVEPDLTGVTIAPGEIRTVWMTVNQRKFGQYSARAQFTTIPPTPSPPLLTLRMVFAGVPEASPPELLVRQYPGERGTANLTVEILRHIDNRPLSLDENNSDFGLLELISWDRQTERHSRHPDERGEVWRDRLELRLVAKPRKFARDKRFMMTLCFDDDVPDLQVEARLIVEHPITAVPPLLFAGVLSPMQAKTIRVRLEPTQPDATLRAIEAIDCRPADVLSVSNDGKGKLRVEVMSPPNVGRFKGIVSVKFQGIKEPVMIPISGIVTRNGR